ncbi:heterokaryon incompatibility protein-domain-containing protein [Flammula alnicola]|nr:heterokaryon incompatibility protein-domain-containing protein [Flammula alnicola]
MRRKPLILDIYHSMPRISSREVRNASWDTIRWTDQSYKTNDLFEIWSLPKSGPVWRVGEAALVPSNTEDGAHTSDKVVPSQNNATESIAPLRLFDCENECLKDAETYLSETNGVAPEYLVVSQVWGDAKHLMSLPSVEWPVPITNKAKWDAILSYCKRENVKWLWMDILCINQDKSVEADQEKKTEIPKMGQYYRGAVACLVVPQDYINFSTKYSQLMDLYSTIIETDAPVGENAFRIWENIASVDTIMSDQWFWRMWTFQELLLPKRHVLLDGQELHIGRLRHLLDWYHKILRNGSLTQPPGGRHYDYIHLYDETVITKNWRPEKLGWDLKEDLEQNGHVDLITLAAQTRDKSCTVQIDRLLGLYGLLNGAEMVPIQTSPDDSTRPTASLEEMWKETLRKVVSSGKVWPLLHDLMNPDPEEAAEGERWIPEITALHRRADAIASYPETLNHRNGGRIAITPAGLEISVRVVGQAVGTSASLGDGGGENNKLFACTWLLKAKGFNTDPIVQHLKDGLAASDGVPPGEVKESQRALDRALSAPSLSDCFYIFEKTDLRRKLAYAAGVAGWDRTVLAVRVEGQNAPMVCLAWTHRSIPPAATKCWVFDVSSNPVSDVKRWVIANEVGKNVFRKIGTVRSYPTLIEDGSIRTADIIFS